MSGEVDDAVRVLGLARMASIEDVLGARRRLARSVHPDVGGRGDEMVRVNRAVEIVIEYLRGPVSVDSSSAWPPVEPSSDVPATATGSSSFGSRRWVIDRPSFVIDVLPVDAFEWLLLAARVLGEVVDEDPPYSLEALLDSRVDRWCRLEIVPDAGSSTISIVAENIDPEDLVALWVNTINELSGSSF